MAEIVVFSNITCNFVPYIFGKTIIGMCVTYLTSNAAIFSVADFAVQQNLLTYTHNYIEPFLFAFIEGRSNCTLFPAGYV